MQAKRAGYSLVEVIVALLVFTVGALAVTAGSAVVARSLRANAIRDRATLTAEGRLESLRASCASAASGSEVRQGITSSWSATGSKGQLRLKESVRYDTPRGQHTDEYESAVLCSP